MDDPGTRLWTPAELSKRWGVETDTIRKWIKRGHLHGVQMGNRQYVPSAEVVRIETSNHAA